MNSLIVTIYDLFCLAQIFRTLLSKCIRNVIYCTINFCQVVRQRSSGEVEDFYYRHVRWSFLIVRVTELLKSVNRNQRYHKNKSETVFWGFTGTIRSDSIHILTAAVKTHIWSVALDDACHIRKMNATINNRHDRLAPLLAIDHNFAFNATTFNTENWNKS